MNIKLDLDLGAINAMLDTTDKGLFGLKRTAALRIAKDIMEDSQERIPRETGSMASTEFIDEQADRVVFGYNGSGVVNSVSGVPVDEYLITQHEDTTFIHPNGGECKFLEKAIDKVAQAEAQDTLAEEALEAFSTWTPAWRGRGKPRGRGSR